MGLFVVEGGEVLYWGKYFQIQLWQWCGYLGGGVTVMYLEKVSSSRMRTQSTIYYRIGAWYTCVAWCLVFVSGNGLDCFVCVVFPSISPTHCF